MKRTTATKILVNCILRLPRAYQNNLLWHAKNETEILRGRAACTRFYVDDKGVATLPALAIFHRKKFKGYKDFFNGKEGGKEAGRAFQFLDYGTRYNRAIEVAHQSDIRQAIIRACDLARRTHERN